MHTEGKWRSGFFHNHDDSRHFRPMIACLGVHALEESPTPMQSDGNRRLLRVAWAVIGIGVLVAMSAAIAGGRNPDANVLPVRNLAAVIMLIGLVLVLGTHRVAWMKKHWERGGETVPLSRARQRSSAVLTGFIVLSTLVGGAFFLVAALTLAGGVVAAYASLLLRAMILTALAAVLVYGRGYLRTFCLGAVIPAGLQAVSAASIGMFLMTPPAWQRMTGFYDVETQLASLVMGGLLAFAAGLVAMAVRFLVESWHGLREPPTDP